MNSNAMWDIYSVGDSNNVVVIKNPSKGYVLYSKGESILPINLYAIANYAQGHGKNVCCEVGKNVADTDAHWEIQGATVDNLDHKVIQ